MKMCDSGFDSVIKTLLKYQASENNKLLKILVGVRKEVDWPKNKDNITKLRENEGLKHIVAHLHSTHKSELDVCLSILGNCCMDKGCTRDLVAVYNILSPLNQLLKRHAKEDSINGRIFRIIGNMCQHRDQWANLIIDRKPQIVTHIVDFVKRAGNEETPGDEKISEATVMMAVRSLRSLLNCQTIMALVKQLGVLKAIGLLFIKYSTEWLKSKKHENILLNIIRLLQDYSRYKYYQSIMEMRNTEKGDSLIHLSSVLLLAPKKIVKIVMNFIRISQLQSDLPIPEICDRFIEVLKNHSIVKEFNGECVEYLQCLCYLLEHPANRNTSRCGKCIPLLIQLLSDFQEPTNNILECCILLIATLNKCKYDDNLMFDQLKCNIVKVLIEKLTWLVGNSQTFNTKHLNEKKRKYKSGNICDGSYSKRFGIKCEELREPRSPTSSDDEFDLFTSTRTDRSPSPASSNESEFHQYTWSSPGSSSPRSQICDLSESDSDDYSPVCSETEDVDNNDFALSSTPLRNDDEQFSERVSDKSSEKDDCEIDNPMEVEINDNNMPSINLKVRLLTEIVKLLKSYIKLRQSTPQLGAPELLIALVKCSGIFEWTFSSNIDTIDVVCRILDSHEYLIPLMLTNFIQNVFELTEPEHDAMCLKCNQYQHVGSTILKKLTALAESGVGKGDIAHKLLRGDNETKQKIVLVIPYIVKNRSILGKLMLNCGGLEILMKLLRDETEFKRRSIKVLCVMAARKLAIANPKQEANGLNRPKIFADKYKINDNCNAVVTFKLDSGEIVKADRNFLSEKSDFFNRLLQGSFKESNEDIIWLQNAELKPLRCLFHLMETLIDKTETIDIDVDLQTLLDIIVLCDRYLMPDMCVLLTDSVEQFRLSEFTIPDIYKWSIESGTNLLRVESIAFALVANITDSERFVMFECLFDLGYSEHLVEDIQKLLVRYLTISEFSDDAKRKKFDVQFRRNRLLKLHV